MQETRYEPETRLPEIVAVIKFAELEADIEVWVHVLGDDADIRVNLQLADPVKEDEGNDNDIAGFTTSALIGLYISTLREVKDAVK